MILDAIYITESDAGNFYSEAKFNCLTGDVFDIYHTDDEDAENIEQVFGTQISVVFENKKFRIDVDPQEDVAINYKNTELYSLVIKKKLNDELEKDLIKKIGRSNKTKV